MYVIKQTSTNTQLCGALYLRLARHQRAVITQLPTTLRLYFGLMCWRWQTASNLFKAGILKTPFKVPLNTGRSSKWPPGRCGICSLVLSDQSVAVCESLRTHLGLGERASLLSAGTLGGSELFGACLGREMALGTLNRLLCQITTSRRQNGLFFFSRFTGNH